MPKQLRQRLPPIPWALWGPQPRAKESLQRIRVDVAAFFSSEMNNPEFIFDTTLEQEFLQIVQQYWSEHDRDHQPNRAQVNREVKRLQNALTKTLAIMDALTQGARLTVTMSLSRRNDHGDCVQDSLNARQKLIRDLNDKITMLLSDNYVKSTGKHAVINACISTTKTWKRLIGRKVKRNAAIEKGNGGASDFPNMDARFLFTVLNAIDSSITTSNLRSALQKGGWGRIAKN